ncbi:MAG: hypothetical protein EPO24_01525 [Bacteroidetes bacterium]|nr:MAG: hypothetical protein EPO24_01525 [Bacteroidota bacterium]
MSVIDKLATSLGIRNETPNQELARTIVRENDRDAVKELVAHLSDRNKNLQSDCIKTLYEIGYLQPKLIAPYYDTFLTFIRGKNNRLAWGAMTALDSLTLEQPQALYKALPEIIAAANIGSVITRDHAVGIMVKLCSIKEYAANAFQLLLEQLETCPANQLPMYAEQAIPIINTTNVKKFSTILKKRLADIDRESKKKRIEKVIKKISAIGKY